MTMLNVLNPVAQMVPEKINPADRLDELSGKTIGLYWNMKSGGDVALKRVAELLEAKYGTIKLRWYMPAHGHASRHSSTEELDKVALDCDAVIGSTND